MHVHTCAHGPEHTCAHAHENMHIHTHMYTTHMHMPREKKKTYFHQNHVYLKDN